MLHKIKICIWLLIILAGSLTTFAQETQKRIALVIGNGSYKNSPALSNPASDASLMTEALRHLDFEVVSAVNQNKLELERLIDDYGEKLAQSNGFGLVYYSGVGVQSNGENYLAPVDASFADEDATVASSVSLNRILEKIDAANNRNNLILLDAVFKTSVRDLWRKSSNSSVKPGFARISAPTGTVVFYTSASEQFNYDRCGSGFFVPSFLDQLEKPPTELGDFLRQVSEEVSKRSKKRLQPMVDGALLKGFYLVDDAHRFDPEIRKSLAALFETFKASSKCPCGERDEALAAAKTILADYGKDEINWQVIEFVKKRSEALIKEETVCSFQKRYNESYKAKNWNEFFQVSNEIIAMEGDSPLALDVLLTHVSVGFSRILEGKETARVKEVGAHAKKAIRLIDSGKRSKTGSWGAFEPFNNAENSLSWLNYIIGYLAYTYENQKKEGINYLYKSTLYKTDNTNQIQLYVTIGSYYYDESVRLDAEYRKRRAANKNVDNEEAKAIYALAQAHADRALDSFGRAYRIAVKNPANASTYEPIKKSLEALFRFRFNLAPGVKSDGMESYIENLISKPMPDPAAKIETVKP